MTASPRGRRCRSANERARLTTARIGQDSLLMHFLDIIGWREIALRLGSAALIGALLGLNRELRGKSAGLRTNALVALGAATLTLGSLGLTTGPDLVPHFDAVSRVVQGIITGIGFLGAGVILRDVGGTRVRGLTTAATTWLVAVFGIVCGLGVWPVAMIGMALTLVDPHARRPARKKHSPPLSEAQGRGTRSSTLLARAARSRHRFPHRRRADARRHRRRAGSRRWDRGRPMRGLSHAARPLSLGGGERTAGVRCARGCAARETRGPDVCGGRDLFQ